MFHKIVFTVEFVADLEIHAMNRLEQMLVERDIEVIAEICPVVVETKDGPVETADVYFVEGAVTRRVPYSYFRFID